MSTMTVSWPTARASSSAERRISRATPRSGWWTGRPPAGRPRAAARGRPAAARRSRRAADGESRPASQRPSLALVVVLPDPCRPAIRITVGGWEAVSSGFAAGAAQDLDHLVAHDAQHRLVGAQALQHVLAHGPDSNPLEELLDDLEVDVRLQERQPDLTQRRVDLGLREDTLAPQRLEDPLEPLGERVEQAHLSWPGTRQAKANDDLKVRLPGCQTLARPGRGAATGPRCGRQGARRGTACAASGGGPRRATRAAAGARASPSSSSGSGGCRRRGRSRSGRARRS